MAGNEIADARAELSKSRRDPLPGARRIADADPNEHVTVTILLTRRTGASAPAAVVDESQGNSPAERRSRRQAFAETQGADPAAIDLVKTFATGHGPTVDDADVARRSVVVSGTVAQVSDAFGVSLGRYESETANYRGREGTVSLPADIANVVEGVFGLDDRPQASPKIQLGRPVSEADLAAGHLQDALAEPNLNGPARHLWPRQVAALYEFPVQLTGAGETIAIIELGGGYEPAELQKYFKRVKVAAPTVTDVAIGSGSNSPGGDADGEVLLDIEVSGSIAPGADIVVYFADNTDQGFLNAVTTAIHSQDHPASVVSISWGGPESAWTSQSLDAFDSAFADANSLGVPVFVAAGDHGAGDAARDGKVHADFPASSPNAVACGGTRLIGKRGAIVDEEVWNDGAGWATGGGVSQYFGVPAYQQSLTLPAALDGGKAGRVIPDIAGDADQATGYMCLIDGQYEAVGGTSAVAPLYSALCALIFQGKGHSIPNLGARLYQCAAAASGNTVFRDISIGHNAVPTSPYGPATGGYSAVPGYDACTGLGSINGDELLKAI